jgi:hypothetical protein
MAGSMAAAGGKLVPLERSANLSDRQREFLSQFLVDSGVQQCIPPSVITENVVLGPESFGLLLTHQPLTGRFYPGDYIRLNEFVSGRMNSGCMRILPSGYDYDLTHTLFYLIPGGERRSIKSEDLTIPEIELSGACILGRQEMAVFLEEIVGACERSEKAVIHSFFNSDIHEWLKLRCGDGGGGRRSGLGEKEVLDELRTEGGLRLDAEPGMWVGYLGMDWPEYFFRQKKVSSRGW